MDAASLIFAQNFLLFGLTVFMMIYLDRLSASPIVAIFSRWFRWIGISLGVPYLIFIFEWSVRPFWMLSIFYFLLWFLLETLYNWVAIAAMSRGDIPLFPKYETNDSGDEWPALRRYIGLREWIRENGFVRIKAARAAFSEEYVLRSSIYENKEGTVRLQVYFLPHRTGKVSVCYSISSRLKSGIRLITDNLYLPFGGFYPENWGLERKPWMRSLRALLKRHLNRLSKCGEERLPWEDDPLDDLNDQQRIIERTNTRLGILVPRHLHEEFGRITWEGRYRFWKELWFLNYFGRTLIG